MLLATNLSAQADEPSWNDPVLRQPPTVYASPGIRPTNSGIQALFFEGPPYRGKPTRVFAWLGIPEHAPGEKAPGIVLVHGGKGTAFESWVQMWMDRGYAAIAMDTCGALPMPLNADPRPRHEHSGPAGWGNFKDIGKLWRDQWSYHAVADAMLAHSLLRSQKGVDPERIGVTGISWGGYIACILAGVDERLRFAMPVYGCGHLDETVFGDRLRTESPDGGTQWLRWWDPSRFLPATKIPMLWVNGTNDAFFFPEPWQKSHRLIAPAQRTLTLIPGLAHGQEAGSGPAELAAFAGSVVRGGEPLPSIISDTREGNALTVRFRSSRPLAKAELVYTIDGSSPWPERHWETVPATLSDDTATASLPPGTRFYFINLTDRRSLVVSTEVGTVP